jgi:hypothetical protein
MLISIVTENFIIPWSPYDLEKFLGGSQECVVLLAEALVRNGHRVHVYLSGQTTAKKEEKNGVEYDDFSRWKGLFYDTIIMFKINPFRERDIRLSCNVIFWSSDVQLFINNSERIKKYVCLTEFHKERNGWVDAVVIPHGVDFPEVNFPKDDFPNGEKIEKEEIMLYCSSLDRGYATLMDNWHEIKKNHKNLKLYITYGFKIHKQISSGTDALLVDFYEDSIKNQCSKDDVFYLGDVDKKTMEDLYKKAKYWCLPLNKDDSELFCFNAIKSSLYGCIPVVYLKGALLETVKDYIPFDNFVKGDLTLVKRDNKPPVYSWDEVVEKYWSLMI